MDKSRVILRHPEKQKLDTGSSSSVCSRERRRVQLLQAILVGGIAGLVAVAFQQTLFEIDDVRTRLLRPFLEYSWWAVPVVLAACISLVTLVARMTARFCPEASGSGIPHLKGVLMNLRDLRWWRLVPVKFLGGVLAIGSGLSLGREGPTVQMGGAIGKMVADRLGLSAKAAPLMISVGAGAGLSAAFNAPLAGFLFVIEELHFELTPVPYITALAASITADTLTRYFSSQLPSFRVFTHATPSLSILPLFILLGIVAGIAAVFFKRTLIGGIRRESVMKYIPDKFVPALAGLAGGAALLLLPEISGGGQSTAEMILNEYNPAKLGMGFVLLLLAGKFLLTVISYLAKVPGGIFAPMLVIGSLIGYAIGLVEAWLIPSGGISPSLFAVIGMASFFSGVVHAPLTGIVLILEMTANFKLLFPMMIASLVAFNISEWLGGKPVYEALLNEDLAKHGPPPILFSEPSVLHMVVEEGSEIESREIRSLGLPEGILIVSIKRLGHRIVPSGATVIMAGDGLELLISGDVSLFSQEIRDLVSKKGGS
ncbi:MAG TPA: H(+)/Cl(-) exchange transporter ClcA [Candidatus Ozemobacteraceae bacterium]|nr:H(+)/Cl(-) exchange transporter ClcA [Candidatus Ozemobacteraceae bacterium]